MNSIGNLILYLVQIYQWILIAAVLMTWVPDIANSPVGKILYRLTEPYFSIFRRFIPPIRMGMASMDLSPIIAFFALYLIQAGLMKVLLFAHLL